MQKMEEKLHEIGIVPVVVLEDEKLAVPLAKALIEGGLPCAEVTFRTSAAAGAIRRMTEECPEILVGAGTVLTPEQVDRAVEAGARFIVSPGLNPEVVKHCQKISVPVIPGCCTPTEVEAAMRLGLTSVKFFPAEPAGGIQMIKAMSAPYQNVKFMPTGGLNKDNVEAYLQEKCILACGGSWMVKGDLLREGRWDEIKKMTIEAAELVKKYRF